MSVKYLSFLLPLLLTQPAWAQEEAATTAEDSAPSAQETMAAEESSNEARITKPVVSKEAEELFVQGKSYYMGALGLREKDLAKAKELFEKAAEMNHPDALYYLGNMYNEGVEVEKNEEEALVLFRKAAEFGQADAQMIIGVDYIYKAVETKPESEEGYALFRKAAEWLKPSAEQGHAEAQFWYGDMLVKGTIGEPDVEKGIELLKKSANQNNANGQAMLAAYYWMGTGLEKDIIQAYKWAYISNYNENDTVTAMRMHIFKEMTAEQVKEATIMASDWLKANGLADEEGNRIKPRDRSLN